MCCRYDKEDGWNENKRQKFRENEKIALTQSQKMPAYTKFGYQKMKIPQQLYDLIYEARYEAKMSIEKCEWEFHNCQRIKSDGTLGKCCVKNFEIVIIYIFIVSL